MGVIYAVRLVFVCLCMCIVDILTPKSTWCVCVARRGQWIAGCVRASRQSELRWNSLDCVVVVVVHCNVISGTCLRDADSSSCFIVLIWDK